MNSKSPNPEDRKVERLVKAGKCLCGCKRDATHRGLAFRCYQAFRRRRAEEAESGNKTFEADCIAEGRILAPQSIRRIKHPSAF